MSKFFIVRSKNNKISKEDVDLILTEISFDFHKSKSTFENGNYYAFQHSTNDVNEITLGNAIDTKKGFKEDGSYIKIKSEENSIIFYCDTFRSKTFYYYLSEDLFILTNSIKASTLLKDNFKLDLSALTNFLSSGNIGKNNLWDADINIVNERYEYEFLYDDWKIITRDEKLYLNDDSESLNDIIINNIKASLLKVKDENAIIPLSGGYDSRLLFNLTKLLNRNIKAINWGKAIENDIYCDKKSALSQSQKLNFKLFDFVLPEKIEDINLFFKKFTFLGECKLDHFNAFSDNYSVWNFLFTNNIRYIIRGDLPFPTGEYVNSKLARQRLDSLNFIDYDNINQFSLDHLLKNQNTCNEFDSLEEESKIEWRDRLYKEIRIPTAISSFYDMTNSYTDTILPLMSYRLLFYYNKLDDNSKLDKKFIKDFSKKLDHSTLPFNASPSIPSLIELSHKEISYMIDYLSNEASIEIYGKNNIDDLIQKLESIKNSTSTTNRNVLINKLKNIIPRKLKYFLKSKQTINLNPIVLSYRIVMSDIYIKSLIKN